MILEDGAKQAFLTLMFNFPPDETVFNLDFRLDREAMKTQATSELVRRSESD